ncbi:glycosyltransferase [Dolichospermum sp. UHCC 0684]|jgi:glycosyltransferase involved in cell wall biosynthesis|uniref:glycosyltransferase n=1 Tax=unclassified Dolichospermum TaxID=2622029 RepID=UPI0014462A7B|nr:MULTISPECIES: glycosyltransferase [unclassified Dolichospermum]MEA5528544.1 glycosyltransferase [Dolichospermum sp. UHCC 0684]MTJ34526.1 glycosyltransferase [Dolichospermum sp. UHCC 0260]
MLVTQKIAIVLATYNPNLEYFQKQIESIKNQTYKNWVCHIIDDCSQMEYQIAIQKVIAEDLRFICHFHNNNLNHYHNFERGLKYAIQDSEITAIALADQDDIWYPKKLSVSLEKLRSEKAVLVHSDLEMIDSNDQIINYSTWKFEARKPEKLSTDLLLLRNVVTGCSVLFCTSLIKDVLPFPPQKRIHWYHDWWIALIAAQKGKIAHIHQPLVMYRIHGLNNVGVTQDAGKFYRELLAWISKKFKITGNSYLVHRDFSKLFYKRFQQELDNVNWSNPFDDKNLDFGFKILKLCYKSLLSGYNSEGIALRIWVLKVLLDLQKIRSLFFKNNNKHE